jgi:hypothetical protein
MGIARAEDHPLFTATVTDRPLLAVCGRSVFGQMLAAQVRSSTTYDITASMLPLFGEQ